jgi:hypothetical protein
VNLPEGAINTPVTILSNTVNTTTPSQVITLASGTASRTSASGDSLWGIFLNGACPTMSETLWSVNDLAYGAEVMAPMYSHALNYVNGDNTITLQAGELAWGLGREDPVIYSVLPMTRLISLWGNSITGGAPISSRECSSLEYTCVGTSVGWGGCPDAGTPVEIASASINIPEGHNGVLAFLAKTRVQAHTYDSGNVLLFLSIDDVEVGGGGVQQIVSPEGISSRTLSASYLSAGEGRLLPGNHIVRVFAQANGSFRHLCTTNDLPLVFFD